MYQNSCNYRAIDEGAGARQLAKALDCQQNMAGMGTFDINQSNHGSRRAGNYVGLLKSIKHLRLRTLAVLLFVSGLYKLY